MSLCDAVVRERATKEHRVLEESLEASTRAKQESHVIMLENEELSGNLVACKLELAQLCEREIIARRELYKAKATNMKLAAKVGDTRCQTRFIRSTAAPCWSAESRWCTAAGCVPWQNSIHCALPICNPGAVGKIRCHMTLFNCCI
jgi:hypothetical protein